MALGEFAWSKASVTESIDPVNIAFCRQHSPLEMDDHPVEQINQSSLEIPHNNSSPLGTSLGMIFFTPPQSILRIVMKSP